MSAPGGGRQDVERQRTVDDRPRAVRRPERDQRVAALRHRIGRWGWSLPHVFPGGRMDPTLPSRCAVAAEAAGFKSVWVMDSVKRHYPSLEPLTVLAAAAAVTRAAVCGSAVVVAGHRSAYEVARSAASIEAMSGGRLALGLGMGRRPDPARGQGLAAGASFEAFIDCVLDHWRSQAAGGGPVLLLGAGAPRALERAARIADGWICSGSVPRGDTARQVTLVREALGRVGRASGGFLMAKRVYVSLHADRHRARDQLERWCRVVYGRSELAGEAAVTGTRQECGEALSELASLGFDLLILTPVADDMRHLEAFAEALL